MKKIIIVVLIILIMIFIKSPNEVIIPDNAIRFRVIANSNTKEDQNTKIIVRNSIEREIENDLKNSISHDTSRKILSSNVNKYTKIIEDTLRKNNITEKFNIKYGMNYFPEKIYKGVKYKAGNYESLVITLGKGEGDNWWCILFPPLCILEAEDTETTSKAEYKFFIKEIIDKYIK